MFLFLFLFLFCFNGSANIVAFSYIWMSGVKLFLLHSRSAGGTLQNSGISVGRQRRSLKTTDEENVMQCIYDVMYVSITFKFDLQLSLAIPNQKWQ